MAFSNIFIMYFTNNKNKFLLIEKKKEKKKNLTPSKEWFKYLVGKELGLIFREEAVKLQCLIIHR